MFKGGRNKTLCLLLMLAGWQLSNAAVIQAKAWLAPVLIAKAWQTTLSTSAEQVRPWPWADTWPVAKMTVPRLGLERYVLAGDRGNALAFGPGHADASAKLGSAGRAVIAGHRDTHFAFLKQLQQGDEFQIQLPDGQTRHYQVQAGVVVDSSRERLYPSATADSLLLVTCYPFDAIDAGGPLRYVVTTRPFLPRYLPSSVAQYRPDEIVAAELQL